MSSNTGNFPAEPGAEPVGPTRQRAGEFPWASWPDEKLLDMRFCDLGLRGLGQPGSMVYDCVAELRRELKKRGFQFRPHFWLSDDWFTPDGVPGTAIPFYLAHPRLTEIELNQMLEVEGGNPDWCLRILRHETGHAIDNAYRLRRRRQRQRLFGKSSQPYPEYYSPRPYSKSFVVHLEMWYAQSHPDEDFAETFAVWLNAESLWQKRYLGWPALRKLEYMDELMGEIASKPPLVRSRRQIDPVSRMQKTIREYYREKREKYEIEMPNLYDRDLRRLFSDSPLYAGNPSAASFLSAIRRDVRRVVRRWTGVYQYTINQVLADMIERCRELNLRLVGPPEQTRVDFIILLTVHTMNYLHSGRHQLAL
jgi:hypothetical protein